jgi:ribosomal protein L16 Arg81 hydroxylase
LAKYFGWGQLNDLLNHCELPSSKVRLFSNGAAVQYSSQLELLREVHNGATIIYDDADRFDQKLSSLADSVSSEIGAATRLNLYYSQRENQAFPPHYDTHDFLILQIAGKKLWKLYPDRADYPLYEMKEHPFQATDSLGQPEEMILTAGDVLYVPKGQWHDAIAQDGPSIHLTFALFLHTGIDFLEWLVSELRSEPEFRRTLFPKLSTANEFRSPSNHGFHSAVNKLLANFSTITKDSSALADQFYVDRTATLYQRNRLNFPDSAEPESLGELDSHTYTWGTQNIVLAPSRMPRCASLVAGGMTFDFDDRFEEPLSRLRKLAKFSREEFVNSISSELREEAEDLLNVFIRFGILRRIN